MKEHSSKGDRQIFGWAMYDWANSAYILTVGTAVFPAYYAAAVIPAEGLPVFGTHLSATSMWGYMLSLSSVLVFLCAPVLGAVADFTASKKRFLALFCYAGSAATLLLGLLPAHEVWLLSALFVVAHACFAAGNVFYDAFLPGISPPGKEDWVSGKGYAYGYVGGGLQLALSLCVISQHDWFGLTEAAAARLSLVSAALWWGGFSLVTFALVREPRLPSQSGATAKEGILFFLRTGVRQVGTTLKNAPRQRNIFFFLCAFLIYNDGVQTVIAMATMYGKEELGLPTSMLMVTLLAIQFVAVPGALFFSRLGERIGAKRALMISLVVWSGLAIYGYFIQTAVQYFILGMVAGLVLGAVQSLSRSMYAVLIPRENAAEYYGFYSVFEKLSVVFGPVVFAVINQVTGTSRLAIVSIVVFFVGGLVLLVPVQWPRKDAS
ncbi:MFS transporter [Desulfovibrio mangrovi]|uniref:MFS transporter n=1 Tax=Desulfovibrio mangrovi TaxID=2976983 RepID=UPI002245C76D|nr:MFS transporter [Desulfovibrio mangrovi]UZP68122.1 MFS transporter [Desulfovibrio mangrovi]